MPKLNQVNAEIIDKINEQDLLIYVERDNVGKNNRFILFFSDESYILCTQEGKSVYINHILKGGDEELNSKFIVLLGETLGSNNNWPVDLFNHLSEQFNRPDHERVEELSKREIKYLMIKAVRSENFLDAAKFRDAITEKN